MTNITKLSSGIMAIGPAHSVEFWSAVNPDEGSCVTADYPREMNYGPTANFVAGQLVACGENRCDVYVAGQWVFLVTTLAERRYHSSVVRGDRILLIGGDSRTTEWISLDGSSPETGPFETRHGGLQCTIQVSSDVIIMLSGWGSGGKVTEYRLDVPNEGTPLTDRLDDQTRNAACGVYQNVAGQQVKLLQNYHGTLTNI